MTIQKHITHLRPPSAMQKFVMRSVIVGGSMDDEFNALFVEMIAKGYHPILLTSNNYRVHVIFESVR